MADTRRPDWHYWGHVPNATMLQAVALSRGIDPDKLRHRTQPGTMGLGKVLDESPEFTKRLRLATANAKTLSAKPGGGGLKHLRFLWPNLLPPRFRGVGKFRPKWRRSPPRKSTKPKS